jgi:hypothetical protein
MDNWVENRRHHLVNGCHVWRRALEVFLTAKDGGETFLSLGFAIRPTVNRYLKYLILTCHDEETETAKEAHKMQESGSTANSS